MLNKSGGKVRLTFKLEQDQVWIGTKERTQKLPLNSIKVSELKVNGYKLVLYLVIFSQFGIEFLQTVDTFSYWGIHDRWQRNKDIFFLLSLLPPPSHLGFLRCIKKNIKFGDGDGPNLCRVKK